MSLFTLGSEWTRPALTIAWRTLQIIRDYNGIVFGCGLHVRQVYETLQKSLELISYSRDVKVICFDICTV